MGSEGKKSSVSWDIRKLANKSVARLQRLYGHTDDEGRALLEELIVDVHAIERATVDVQEELLHAERQIVDQTEPLRRENEDLHRKTEAQDRENEAYRAFFGKLAHFATGVVANGILQGDTIQTDALALPEPSKKIGAAQLGGVEPVVVVRPSEDTHQPLRKREKAALGQQYILNRNEGEVQRNDPRILARTIGRDGNRLEELIPVIDYLRKQHWYERRFDPISVVDTEEEARELRQQLGLSQDIAPPSLEAAVEGYEGAPPETREPVKEAASPESEPTVEPLTGPKAAWAKRYFTGGGAGPKGKIEPQSVTAIAQRYGTTTDVIIATLRRGGVPEEDIQARLRRRSSLDEIASVGDRPVTPPEETAPTTGAEPDYEAIRATVSRGLKGAITRLYNGKGHRGKDVEPVRDPRDISARLDGKVTPVQVDAVLQGAEGYKPPESLEARVAEPTSAQETVAKEPDPTNPYAALDEIDARSIHGINVRATRLRERGVPDSVLAATVAREYERGGDEADLGIIDLVLQRDHEGYTSPETLAPLEEHVDPKKGSRIATFYNGGRIGRGTFEPTDDIALIAEKVGEPEENVYAFLRDEGHLRDLPGGTKRALTRFYRNDPAASLEALTEHARAKGHDVIAAQVYAHLQTLEDYDPAAPTSQVTKPETVEEPEDPYAVHREGISGHVIGGMKRMYKGIMEEGNTPDDRILAVMVDRYAATGRNFSQEQIDACLRTDPDYQPPKTLEARIEPTQEPAQPDEPTDPYRALLEGVDRRTIAGISKMYERVKGEGVPDDQAAVEISRWYAKRPGKAHSPELIDAALRLRRPDYEPPETLEARVEEAPKQRPKSVAKPAEEVDPYVALRAQVNPGTKGQIKRLYGGHAGFGKSRPPIRDPGAISEYLAGRGKVVSPEEVDAVLRTVEGYDPDNQEGPVVQGASPRPNNPGNPGHAPPASGTPDLPLARPTARRPPPEATSDEPYYPTGGRGISPSEKYLRFARTASVGVLEKVNDLVKKGEKDNNYIAAQAHAPASFVKEWRMLYTIEQQEAGVPGAGLEGRVAGQLPRAMNELTEAEQEKLAHFYDQGTNVHQIVRTTSIPLTIVRQHREWYTDPRREFTVSDEYSETLRARMSEHPDKAALRVRLGFLQQSDLNLRLHGKAPLTATQLGVLYQELGIKHEEAMPGTAWTLSLAEDVNAKLPIKRGAPAKSGT